MKKFDPDRSAPSILHLLQGTPDKWAMAEIGMNHNSGSIAEQAHACMQLPNMAPCLQTEWDVVLFGRTCCPRRIAAC
jgi:hypothetical protein